MNFVSGTEKLEREDQKAKRRKHGLIIWIYKWNLISKLCWRLYITTDGGHCTSATLCFPIGQTIQNFLPKYIYKKKKKLTEKREQNVYAVCEFFSHIKKKIKRSWLVERNPSENDFASSNCTDEKIMNDTGMFPSSRCFWWLYVLNWLYCRMLLLKWYHFMHLLQFI